MSITISSAALTLQLPEILQSILTCRHILDLNDLFSASLVNRTWYQVSKRAQWIRVELDSDSWVDPYHQALAAQLSKHGHLVRTLVLKECVADHSLLEALLPYMTHLQSIVVGRVTLYNRSSSLLQSLELIPIAHLQHLSLPHVSTTSGRVDLLRRVCESQSHKLHHLELLDSEIGDDVLEDIARTCPSLRTLDLSRNEVIAFKGFPSNNNDCDGSVNGRLENWTESWLSQGASSTITSAVLPATVASSSTTTPVSTAVSKQWVSNRISPYSQRQGVQEHDATFDADDTLGVLFSRCKQQQTQHRRQQQQHKQLLLYREDQTLTRRPFPLSKLLQEDPPFLHLEELSLVFCFGIANTEFQTLFRFFRNKSLRSLNLQFTNIEDSGLEALAHNLGHRLTGLSVSYCNRITARGIRALVDRCPRLLELEFLSCDLISADCFRTPEPWGCRQLRRLEFTFHPRVAMARMESERAEAEAEERKQLELELEQEQQQNQGQSTLVEPMADSIGINDNDLVSSYAQNQSQHGQAQQHVQHLEQQNQQQQTPTHTNEQDKQALPLENKVCLEESQVRKEQCRDSLWQDEQESVRNDYHALFRQLKRLTELRYLNIYNSPVLNSPSGETSQSSDSSRPSEVPASNSDEPDPAVPPADDTLTAGPLQESWSGFTVGPDESSSNSSDDITMASRREHRRPSIISEGERSTDEEMDAEGHPSTLQDHDCQSIVSPSVSTELSDSSQEVINTTTAATLSVSEPTSIHPFSLRMGLKALERLTNLESLTFYERSSVTLEATEVRWIGKNFPHLSLLQLRGAIDVPEEALRQLASRRPDIRVQVCSLFD